MRQLRAAVTVACLVVAGAARPAETVRVSGLKGAYGAAGCGLGSLLFGRDPGGVQIFAATTNFFLFNQTFAITSGTWNCGEAVVGRAGTRTFIEANREALAKDSARGAGEAVDTLSFLAGCADARAVGAVLQQRFAELFPGPADAAESVAEGVIRALASEPSLACGGLG